jgi:hypothetical protein
MRAAAGRGAEPVVPKALVYPAADCVPKQALPKADGTVALAASAEEFAGGYRHDETTPDQLLRQVSSAFLGSP